VQNSAVLAIHRLQHYYYCWQWAAQHSRCGNTL